MHLNKVNCSESDSDEENDRDEQDAMNDRNNLSDFTEEDDAGEPLEPVSGHYTFELFYRSFKGLDKKQRELIYKEFAEQSERESRKHESYIQRQGVLFAFSSLILIESIINVENHPTLETYAGGLYISGLLAIVFSMIVEIWGILSSYTHPQIGIHLWDLEDRVIADKIDTLEEDITEEYLRSMDWYIYCNTKLHMALIASSITLLVGAVFVVTSILMGV